MSDHMYESDNGMTTCQYNGFLITEIGFLDGAWPVSNFQSPVLKILDPQLHCLYH